jgi:AraC-like DNA-binding protein
MDMAAGMSGGWVSRTGRLQAARAFIENNLAWSDLSPASTAQALNISVRQLHLLFEPMGTTFSKYVLARRLERAQQALASEPTRRVIEIAFSCGIDSSTVFYRGFRNAFGMSPGDYRRSLPELESSPPQRASTHVHGQDVQETLSIS